MNKVYFQFLFLSSYLTMPEQKIPFRNTGQFLYLVFSLLILFLFSIITIISAIGTYRISIEGSKNLLETRAIDVAVNLGFALEKLGLKEDLFLELINNERWEDLAFLVLYDMDCRILLHSNPHLTGRIQGDPFVLQVLRAQRPIIHFARLATGEQVFILDFPLHLHLPEKGKESILARNKKSDDEKASWVYCLRVALHPYPAQAIVRRANLQLVLIGVSLVILWLLTFFFLWIWRRSYRLEIKLRDQERMAALGSMAAVLAHEIRNPLSSIKGFAQYHLESSKDPRLREDMEIIVDEARRLERLTSDLLAYARPTELNISQFQLDRFCKDLSRAMGSIHDGNIMMDCSKDTVNLDREKLLQISINLIQNALDATSGLEHGLVHFRCQVHEGELVINVEDNGPGIPKELKSRVVEPFVTTKIRGTGLGLAIVRRLTEAMNGKFDIKDAQGGGTIAEVKIPLEIDEHEEPLEEL